MDAMGILREGETALDLERLDEGAGRTGDIEDWGLEVMGM